MDFLEVLKEKLESLSFTPPIINIGSYNTGKNSVAIRPTPSSIDTRFLDEGKIYPYTFQLLVHHSDNFQANTMIHLLMQELDGLGKDYLLSKNGSFQQLSIWNYTTPNHVEVTSHGDLWTALFEAELYIEGNEA